MLDDELYRQYRPLLFAIAYRMLGSVMDAEDIVQEAFLRWRAAASSAVESPKAYLTTVVTRLCIDQLRSARAQREAYFGPWLPEPLLTTPSNTPEEPAMLAESIAMAFLVLLESLTPVERAVFLLHDVFDYSFAEIAPIVGKSEANCRQIAGRAREQVNARRPRFDARPEEQARLVQQFMATCASGDLQSLVTLLAGDVTIWSDGGGKVRAAPNAIHGASNVARFLLAVIQKAPPGMAALPAPVNGQPGIVTFAGDQIAGVFALDIAGGRIQAIRVVVNPDKLRGVTMSP